MTLKLQNTVDKREYFFYNLEDINDSKMFFHFNIRLEAGMPDGSYEYTLIDNNAVVARGNVQVGEYTQTNTAYTKNNEFIQYKG